MDANLAIPFSISLMAFVVADVNAGAYHLIAAKAVAVEDRTSVRHRLAQIGKGSQEAYENFRLAQLTVILLSQLLLTAFLFLQFLSFAGYIALSIVSPICAVLMMEKNLSNRCARKLREIDDEFPAVVEMLALAVGAGESPVTSLKLISTRAAGHLSAELAAVINDIEQGVSLAGALDAMSRRVNTVGVRRFVDSLIISISRGTPLVETLTHSVNESRNQERVRLLTAAGKSEVSMMIPVVFLILPISILFALFPSITNLNLFGS